MAKLKPCPLCKNVPHIGYVCGEYFIIGADDNCSCCRVALFIEMHASEEQEIQEWNSFVDLFCEV